ncbi:hypothetical protein PoB_000820900 [Plakobranchus ocellatus]|uniref:Uncharacterized protein n=1 Tax=Plakobranchus ocellatus TaxID=259542 RepID=A0AAV3YFD2_9GAST|nr:hypothetical protein PoB_000820900 [Plakobranchus ocellatus]
MDELRKSLDSLDPCEAPEKSCITPSEILMLYTEKLIWELRQIIDLCCSEGIVPKLIRDAEVTLCRGKGAITIAQYPPPQYDWESLCKSSTENTSSPSRASEPSIAIDPQGT